MMNRLCGIAFLLIISFQSIAQDDSRPYQPDLKGDLMLDFGFSYWSLKHKELPLEGIGSNAVSFFYNRRFELNDHFAFHPGVGLSFDKYSFSGSNIWSLQTQSALDTDRILFPLDSLIGGNTTKNKLNVAYFEIPLEIRYHPLGTEEGEGWFIGAGIIGGLRIGANQKIKYDFEGETIKDKSYQDHDLKGFRYGIQFRFGFRNIHLYYKNYLSDLFDNSPFSDNKMPNASTIGINISGF